MKTEMPLEVRILELEQERDAALRLADDRYLDRCNADSRWHKAEDRIAQLERELAEARDGWNAEHEAYERAATDAYKLKDELAESRSLLGELAEKYNALVERETELTENQALADEEVSLIHEVGRDMQARAEAADDRLAAVAQAIGDVRNLHTFGRGGGVYVRREAITAALTAPAESRCEGCGQTSDECIREASHPYQEPKP